MTYLELTILILVFKLKYFVGMKLEWIRWKLHFQHKQNVLYTVKKITDYTKLNRHTSRLRNSKKSKFYIFHEFSTLILMKIDCSRKKNLLLYLQRNDCKIKYNKNVSSFMSNIWKNFWSIFKILNSLNHFLQITGLQIRFFLIYPCLLFVLIIHNRVQFIYISAQKNRYFF
jgi:hypothetical protein